MNSKTMHKLSYGLFVLTASENGKENGCIINTVNQITNSPKRISIAVNKENYTCQMIEKTGLFNISVLTEEAPYSLFKLFGYESGKNVNKFDNCPYVQRCKNNILALNKYTNAVISAKVVNTIDNGTHQLFIADVTEEKISKLEDRRK